jgi:hypothetical protein
MKIRARPSAQRSPFRGQLPAGLAIQSVLQAATQPLRALDALALERLGEPFVPFPHAPDCAIGHGGKRNLVRHARQRNLQGDGPCALLGDHLVIPGEKPRRRDGHVVGARRQRDPMG